MKTITAISILVIILGIGCNKIPASGTSTMSAIINGEAIEFKGVNCNQYFIYRVYGKSDKYELYVNIGKLDTGFYDWRSIQTSTDLGLDSLPTASLTNAPYMVDSIGGIYINSTSSSSRSFQANFSFTVISLGQKDTLHVENGKMNIFYSISD